MKLRVPAVLAVSLLGCGEAKKPPSDAKLVDGPCQVLCLDDYTDAGMCAEPPMCVAVNGQYGECPGGCFCTSMCFPDVPGSGACETNPPRCAGPERTCPPGCTPLS
jgi:hypothetical protein